MFRWWADLSVSKKLYAVVGVLALLIATELFTLLFAMDVLSAVRTFVGGEGLWSKAQKNAIYSLHRYAYTGDPRFFADFERALEVPDGDHEARRLLQEPELNRPAITAGFVRGGIDVADVPGLIKLIHRFHWVPHITRAITIWNEADAELGHLRRAAARLRTAVVGRTPDRAGAESALAEVDRLNDRMTTLEASFSSVLGEGSRWLEGVLTLALLLAVLLVEGTGVTLTILFSRALSRGLNEVMVTARRVGTGDFAARAPVRSADELGQLAVVINEMGAALATSHGRQEKAESASQIKSQFLANMSHEIRTPLNVMMGLAEILRDPNLAWTDHLRYVDTIERTGKNLSRIINDILDLSKVEADHLEIRKQKFSLPEFMSELQAMLSVQARSSGNQLAFEPRGGLPSEIVTDRTRLRQILINLAGNALKFTKGGRVTLAYWLNGVTLSFEVTDNGVGISSVDKERLFRAFNRGEPTSETEGSGLGLSLAKRLAQALGGDVKLHATEVGHGSVFKATIKPDQFSTVLDINDKRNLPGTTAQDGCTLKNRRVLVVEDSEDNRLLVKLLLSRQGMIVDFAENGQVAVDQAPGGEYDFVLMDMQMPVMDGYAATRELRERGYQTPILALTAHAMKEDRARCLAAGCDEYLTKPIDSRALYAALNRHLREAAEFNKA